MRKIKVDISVIGRFFAFDLAKSLQERGMLNKLFTTYPKFKAREFGVKSGNIVSCWWCEVLVRVMRKLGLIQKNPANIYLYHHCYMNALSRYVGKSSADVFVCFAGISLEAIKIAKSKGMITILERGSSHCAEQRRIVDEEYELQGMKTKVGNYENEEVFVRELQEYELVDYISIPSTYVKRTFLERGFDENRLLLNPYGVDLDTFKQIPKTDDIFRVLFVGSGDFRKGLHYLLQAFYELDLPNSELCIISGYFEDGMQDYVDRYRRDNIKICGPKPFGELYKYYSQASVFVLPSIEEGFALVQFQAMACGLPIICSTNTGGEDLISAEGEEGFVVPIRDALALKEKILFLYENPDALKSMGEKAKKRVSTGFTWDDYGARYADNLTAIFDKRDGGKRW